MTKSTKKSDLKGKKVSVVGHGDVSKAVITSPVPLEQENSNEDKVSQRDSSKPVPEEETPRSGGAKGGSRRKARQYIVVPNIPPPQVSDRALRLMRRYCVKKSREIYGQWKLDGKDARK